MLSLIDQALSPKHKRRSLDDVEYVVIHRTIGETAEECLKEFQNTEKFQAGWYTGGLFPYHFIIPPFGDAVQCLPLSVKAPAALEKLNKLGIHIAALGDFRKRPPTPGQVIRLNHLTASLTNAYNGGLRVLGHTEDKVLANLQNSSDPNKECPGKYCDMNAIRAYVDANLSGVCELSVYDGLKRAGFVI